MGRGLNLLLTLVLLASAAVAGAPREAAPVELESSPAIPGATLIEGNHAKFLLRRPNGSFRAYAWRDGRLAPIPFQVDERDPKGRWVIDQGPHPNPDFPPRSFDENDAIVFMNRDLGERAKHDQLPMDARLWAEVRVGPARRPLGWIYVASFDSPPPLSSDLAAYVSYDPTDNRAYGARYSLEFDRPLPNHVAFVERLGDFGENRIVAVRARGEARILGNLFRLERSEKDIRAELYGHRAGPVRVIRRGQYWIRLPLGFKAKGKVDLIFYRDFVEGTALAKIKIPPRLVPADGELTAYFDFADLSGAELVVDGSSDGVKVDGAMSEVERGLRGRAAEWAALRLSEGQTFLLAVRRGGALAKLDQRLFYEDRSSAGADGRGRKPGFGFELSKVNRLETGEHRLSVFGMMLPDGSRERLESAAGILLAPPEVTVTPIVLSE